MAGHMHDMMDEGTTMMAGHPGAMDDSTMMMEHDHDAHATTGDGDHSNLLGHYFYFHRTVDTTILFRQWVTTSWEELLYSCIGVAIVAVLYEFIKAFREYLYRKLSKNRKGCARFCYPLHFVQTLLHMLQVLVSYLLMLVFMTFNVYLGTAVIVGAGLGYMLARWSSGRHYDELDEHCH